MVWSTSRLAELAGTTVKTVRYYHARGLLDEPERASNGYKQYGATHLVQLLRVQRLSGLGLSLNQIVDFVDGGEDSGTDRVLGELDDELAVAISRLQRMRAELARVRHRGGSIDLPRGFDSGDAGLSEADRALILIYSRVYDESTMAALSEMLLSVERTAESDEFDRLHADADGQTRQDLAERYAPQIDKIRRDHPGLESPVAHSRHGVDGTDTVLRQAFEELYNGAQLDVLARVQKILHPERR